ncbi:MAG: M15 family metallopeptidase [Butyrivibrio sp.]|jgi:hypothetical protein|nr:M15 family metallopeptidase [Butyrivibrio sp.]
MKYWKDVAILIAVIAGCSIGAHILNSGETLSDYAQKNPSLAYGTTARSTTSASSASAEQPKSETSSSAASAKKTESDNASSASSAKKTESDNASSASSAKKTESDNASSAASAKKAGAETASSAAPAKKAKSDSTSATVKETVYRSGFSYEPVPDDVLKRIKGISYPKDCPVAITTLRYCKVLYIDFNGEKQSGELICNKSIADDVMEIFSNLYDNGYQIESIRLIDDYGGDDESSMEADNTSCFNYRTIAGSKKMSKHSLGLAIDINPLYNPSITYDKKGNAKIAPSNATDYADRTVAFPYKIDDQDLAFKEFTSRGFTWGGNWNSLKDYQHFEK